MNSLPLISVAMGTFNGAEWIERSVRSLQAQTYSNIEIIICDDASTDNTVSIVKRLAESDPRIILIENERNCGLNIALNNCIDCSHGEFIARMDDDDISHPDRFAVQIDFMLKHPEYAVVGCSKNFFDESGVWGKSQKEGEVPKSEVFRSRSFSHPTVMMRKSALSAVGNYSTNSLNRRGQDYDLWCKLYAAGFKGYNLGEILFDYYESKSSVKRRKIKYRINHVRKELYWRDRLGLSIRYIIYPVIDLAKCVVPQFLYRVIRKRKFK